MPDEEKFSTFEKLLFNIGKELKKVREWTEGQREAVVWNVEQYFAYRKLAYPKELEPFRGDLFLNNLLNNRPLCNILGIPCSKALDYIADIKVAAASYAYDKYVLS